MYIKLRRKEFQCGCVVKSNQNPSGKSTLLLHFSTMVWDSLSFNLVGLNTVLITRRHHFVLGTYDTCPKKSSRTLTFRRINFLIFHCVLHRLLALIPNLENLNISNVFLNHSKANRSSLRSKSNCNT